MQRSGRVADSELLDVAASPNSRVLGLLSVVHSVHLSLLYLDVWRKLFIVVVVLAVEVVWVQFGLLVCP